MRGAVMPRIKAYPHQPCTAPAVHCASAPRHVRTRPRAALDDSTVERMAPLLRLLVLRRDWLSAAASSRRHLQRDLKPQLAGTALRAMLAEHLLGPCDA
jgi:hypothetical protein